MQMAAAVVMSDTSDSASPKAGMDSKEPFSEGNENTDQRQVNEGEPPPHLDGGGLPADEPSVESMREEIAELKMVRRLWFFSDVIHCAALSLQLVFLGDE